MTKEKRNNILVNTFTNIYVKNISLMIIIFIAVVALALWGLNIYTRHNNSVTVPDLKGMQIQDVNALISGSKLRFEVVDSIYNKEGTPGSILEQIPLANSKVKEGRTIYITVQSVNEPLVTVPDLEDTSLRQAQTLLQTIGFTNITVSYIPSEYRDLVYSIEYRGSKLKAGQKIPKGSAITIMVGNGGGTSETSLSDSIDNIKTNIISEDTNL